MVNNFSFDLLFWRRFIKIFAHLNSNVTTFAILIFLLTLAILQEAANYNVGMITGAYYKILGDKDVNQFWIHTIKAVLLIAGLVLIKSCKEYTASTLYIEWRQLLTKRLHSLYFMDTIYYRLNVIERENDNLDQRITQDVDKMCKHLSSVLPNLIVAPFTIAFYAYRLNVTIGYAGPVGCVAFFLVGTLINRFLMSPVINLVYTQEKMEGVFRYQHMHVRSNAESIAFLNGGEFEFDKSETKLHKLVSVQENLILKEFYLKSSVYLFDYLGSIVSFIVLAFPLFAGKYDQLSATDLSELISQNAFVSIYLISSFTKLLDTSTDFTVIGGTTHRIAEMIEIMTRKPIPFDRRLSAKSAVVSSNHTADTFPRTYFKLTNVNIEVPQTNKRLITKLNLNVCDNSNLLIAGESGTCKTSILRVLKGIWNETNGYIERYLPIDDPNIVLFLPQKPVFTTGSLCEQITYPLKYAESKYENDDLFKEQVIHYMRFLSLGHILDRVDNEVDRDVNWEWNDCLSPGELQRISFVRLFCHRPTLAILDESTSAISLQMEQIVYDECKRLNITLISCGHRTSLEQYHNEILKLFKSDDSDSPVNQWIHEKL